ncbi:MAG: serine/threonine-protein kinase [Nannocystaceae bacterium]
MEPHDTPLALRLQRDAVKARLFGETRLSTRVGRYALLRRLGAGGIGVVYSAYDDELDRKVALKLVAADRLGPATVARVRREAQALARLSHPNVVHVYEVGEVEGHAYVAMEYVVGQTLRGFQEAPGRGADELLGAYLEAGQGLAAAHAAGLVHRDFKPENALVGDDGRVRVVDFGLARVHDFSPSGQVEWDMSKETVDGGPSTVDERGAAGQGGEPADRGVVGDAPGARSIASAELGLDPLGDRIPRGPGEGAAPIARPRGAEARLTASGALVGTPAYMAPEQLDGGEADARSDLFSFCAALYEALHGRRPFDGADAAALRRAIAAGVDPRPPALEVPRGVHEAILRGLAEDPGARWPTMDALLVALRRRPERARRRAWIGAVLLVLSLGTCLFGYLECVARRAADHDEDLGRARARVQAAESARRSADEAAARASASDLARRLVAASSAAARRDPEAGILYAIEAWTASQGAGASVQGEAEEALRDALDAVKGAPLVDPEGHAGLRAAALAADGRWAATRDADGVLRLWAIDAGAPQLRARIPGAPERAPLVFAGAGVLVTLGPDGGVETVSASRPLHGGPRRMGPDRAWCPRRTAARSW